MVTLRLNIGECVAAAYTSVSIPSATKILMFDRDSETISFITTNYPDWVVKGNAVHLNAAVASNNAAKSTEINSEKLISQTLAYATELERIV